MNYAHIGTFGLIGCLVVSSGMLVASKAATKNYRFVDGDLTKDRFIAALNDLTEESYAYCEWAIKRDAEYCWALDAKECRPLELIIRRCNSTIESEKKDRYRILFEGILSEAEKYTKRWKREELGIEQGNFVPGKEMSKKEVEAWFSQCMDVQVSAFGKREITLVQFFAELRHPRQESLASIKEAIFKDGELLYAGDKKTGLSPLGFIITAYPIATAVEKEHLKAIFMYLLEAGAVCQYNMENRLQPDLLHEQLSVWAELTTSLPKSVADRMRHYIWNDSELQSRLKRTTKRLFEEYPEALYPDGTGQTAEVPLSGTGKRGEEPKEEQENGLRPIFWVLGAAVACCLYRYLRSTSAEGNNREQTAESGMLMGKGMQ